jgi:hypothetical protein
VVRIRVISENSVQRSYNKASEIPDSANSRLAFAQFAFFLGQSQAAIGPLSIYERDFDGLRDGDYWVSNSRRGGSLHATRAIFSVPRSRARR